MSEDQSAVVGVSGETAPPAPELGDVVVYHFGGRAGRVDLAAIIVKVHSADSGSVNLKVLDDGYTLDEASKLVSSVLRAGERGQLSCWSPKR